MIYLLSHDYFWNGIASLKKYLTPSTAISDTSTEIQSSLHSFGIFRFLSHFASIQLCFVIDDWVRRC